MNVSLNWLKKHVSLPTGTSAQEVALKLTMSTVEVESIKDQSKNLEGIVVAKIKKINNHPNADKLKVCQVDIGEKNVQVVCGGSNLKENMLVALAKIGSYIKWHGEGELVELKPATIRGENSEGMICASTEIGLDERFPLKEEREILDLSFLSKIKAGTSLAVALSLNDTIIEIDNKSMTNRPDLWGHYGLARELAAIYSKKLNKYELEEIKESKEKKLSVLVEDVKLCPRYSAVEIKNIKIGDSPQWLKDKLTAIGLNSINNIVDITNFVMLDLGQPLHAFDAEAVIKDKIIVRQAKEKEEFVALDGKKYQLDSSCLVIADEKKTIALAGIIGGEMSSISDKTSRIILESANFEPTIIRKASTMFGLRTDASMRFEKSLDPSLCSLALKKAVQMILEVCPEAEVCSKVIDESHFYLQQGPIETTVDCLNKKIGINLDKKIIVNILERLGFEVKSSKNNLSIRVPSWRATKDISIAEDLVEEISRIYGYDNIKASLPSFPIIPPPVNQLRFLEHKIKGILSNSLGFFDVYNYSFVSPLQINNLGEDINKYIVLNNPLSKEKPFLRRSLLPNLLENLKNNFEYQDELRLMETGKTFLIEEPGTRAEVKGDELLPRQDTYLTIVFGSKKEKIPFWEVKKAWEIIAEEFKFSYLLKDNKNISSRHHPGRVAEILVAEKNVGQIYELNPMVGEKFGLENRVGVLEVNLSLLSEIIVPEIIFQPLPLYPELERDVAIIIEKKFKHEEIVKTILGVSDILKRVELFDVYEGENIPKGFKSLAYHLVFYDGKKTLTTKEADEVQEKIIKSLQSKFGAEIRR